MISRSQNEQSFVPSALDDVVGGFHDIHSPDISCSAYCPHFSGAPSEYFKLLSEPRAVLADGSQQRWIRQAVDNVRRHGSNERATSECRTVIAGVGRRDHDLRYENSAHWQAARQWLGESEHVGNDARILVREQMTRASEAALDLVEDERDFPFGSQPAKTLQE